MTNYEAALRLGNITLKHEGLDYEALHRGMNALSQIDDLIRDRDEYKKKADEADEWFNMNAGVLATHCIGGFKFI